MHFGLDGKVRSVDVEYKIPGESKFCVTTRPIHKLVLMVPVEEQTMEESETPEGSMKEKESPPEERQGPVMRVEPEEEAVVVQEALLSVELDKSEEGKERDMSSRRNAREGDGENVKLEETKEEMGGEQREGS